MTTKYYKIGTRNYSPEKSTRICETPQGTLFQKRGKSQEFFLFNWKDGIARDVVTPLSWTEANDLVKQYGTQEQHAKLFTVYSASQKTSRLNNKRVYIDDYHYIKAQRGASQFNLSVKEYICKLIDEKDTINNRRRP